MAASASSTSKNSFESSSHLNGLKRWGASQNNIGKLDGKSDWVAVCTCFVVSTRKMYKDGTKDKSRLGIHGPLVKLKMK